MSRWSQEARAQLRLALPVVAIQIGLIAMGVVDGAFMGRVSAEHYAATSIGHIWTFLFLCLGMGTLSALDPIVSQAWGAGDHRAIGRALKRGLVMSVLFTAPIGVGMALCEPAFRALGQPPEVVPIASAYARVSIAGVTPFLAFVALRQTLQAMHRLRGILAVILAANVLNALLDWLWIGGHLGFPAAGAVGSAWATVASRWAMALGLLVVARGDLRRYLVGWEPVVLRAAPLARIVRIGLPIGVTMLFEVGAFGAVGFLAGRFGKEALAAHQLAITIASVSFMVPLGISMAASVRVGHALGREDAAGARAAALVALAGGAAVMGVAGLVLLTAPGPLARLLTDLPEVHAVAVVLVPLAGLFQVFDGIQVVATGVLRGLADTFAPMLIHLAGFWGAGIPLGYALAWRGGLGPAGLWWGLLIGLAAVAAIQTARVRFRFRRALERVVIDDDPAGGGLAGLHAGPPECR